MRIGLIYCAYGTKDLVPKSLAPWYSIPDTLICAVNVCFDGFEGQDDGTRDLLRRNLDAGLLDRLIDSPDGMTETEARGKALIWLEDQGCDLIIQWDSDEVASTAEIQRMLRFIDDNPFFTWFRFSYRNLVFDTSTWLAEPFTPPRAFRVHTDGYTAHSFGADNDIWYGGNITRDIIPPHRFASLTIPTAIFNPLHYTWLNDERSRLKVAYQTARGWQCSFAWDDSKGGLIFNPALPTPKVIRSLTS